MYIFTFKAVISFAYLSSGHRPVALYMRNLVKGDARAATSHDKRYQQQINTNKEKNTLMLLELQQSLAQ
jgi:hypothetical protein